MTTHKHIPERTCIGCGEKKPKRELLRIVKTPGGEVKYDPSGKASGRGTYICPSITCLKKALKGNKLARTLRIELTVEMKTRLEEEIKAAIERIDMLKRRR